MRQERFLPGRVLTIVVFALHLLCYGWIIWHTVHAKSAHGAPSRSHLAQSGTRGAHAAPEAPRITLLRPPQPLAAGGTQLAWLIEASDVPTIVRERTELVSFVVVPGDTSATIRATLIVNLADCGSRVAIGPHYTYGRQCTLLPQIAH